MFHVGKLKGIEPLELWWSCICSIKKVKMLFSYFQQMILYHQVHTLNNRLWNITDDCFEVEIGKSGSHVYHAEPSCCAHAPYNLILSSDHWIFTRLKDCMTCSAQIFEPMFCMTNWLLSLVDYAQHCTSYCIFYELGDASLALTPAAFLMSWEGSVLFKEKECNIHNIIKLCYEKTIRPNQMASNWKLI